MKDIRKVIGLLLCMTICCYMTGEEKKNLNIVFIGNSITQGALLENPRHEAPPCEGRFVSAQAAVCRNCPLFQPGGKWKYDF